jgi:ATP-dependent DNA helicase RecG
VIDLAVAAALDAVLDGTEARNLESQTLEFKIVGRSRSDTLQRLAETAACFANARGGTIVVGVADQSSGADAFVGHTLDAARAARRIYELTEPALTVNVEDIRYAGHDLLTIAVPSSPEVHAVGGRSTERVGDACEPMSTQRIATVVADRRDDDWSGHDSRVPVTQVQPIALSIARSMLARVADPTTAAYGQRSDADLLRSLGLISPDGALTNAGALLFTDDLDRGEQLVYIHRRTPSGALVVNEHLGGPLLTSLERALELVDARLDRTSINLPGGQQLQVADLPDAAVREAIVNAVMHRDYRRSGPVQVEHAATRLTVDSPGPFVTGVTAQNVLTTSSRSRNSALARAIRTLGLAETAGSGVDRMYVEMARVGHQPPTFHDDHDRVRVRLLGGAPNAAITRFVATLPSTEAQDADTMLVLLHLLTNRTVSAAQIAPLLQKARDEALATLDRLAGEPTRLIERTRHDARRAEPKFRLTSPALAALGTSVTYRRSSTEESDRKIVGLVRETGEINARMVRLMLDLDTPATSRLLADLVERGLLVKTSEAQRGPSVTYGPGPRLPVKRGQGGRARRQPPEQQRLPQDDAQHDQ